MNVARKRESRSETLFRLADVTKKDLSEQIEAARLQAFAWRNLCMIAMVDAKKARGLATMLFFHSVPFVNGEWLKDFNEKYASEAREAGHKAGVFSPVKAMPEEQA